MTSDCYEDGARAGRRPRYRVFIDLSGPGESSLFTSKTRLEFRSLVGIVRVYRAWRIGKVAGPGVGNCGSQRRIEIHRESSPLEASRSDRFRCRL